VLHPAFIDSAGGRILCTAFLPERNAPDYPTLLFLPPFAEELNKSRRMLARLGHALSRHGIAMVLPDLHGTGDSAGDFSGADWSVWRDNVVDAANWVRSFSDGPLMLGGLRTGALLARDVAGDLSTAPPRLLFWSPVLHGQPFLTQFLRLRVAAGLSGGERESTSDLRARLAGGETLRVAGYELPGRLAATIDSLDGREQPPGPETSVTWLELSRADPPRCPPAAVRTVESWRGRGCEVELDAVAGDSFWATQELVDVPDLVRRSVESLAGPAG